MGHDAPIKRRSRPACRFFLLILLHLWPVGVAAALPPLSAFKHVSWSIERDAPSRINAIGQSRDGYLWIGSVEGLFRFDGARFEQIRPRGKADPRIVVAEVLGARSGDLWVGLARSGGVAVYRDGRLIDAAMPHPSREVTGLAEDRDGAIWVARGGRSSDILARYAAGRWREYGPADGLPDDRIWGLHAARDGALWVVLADAIAVKRAGSPRFETLAEPVTPRASIAEDAQGRIWVSDAKSTRLIGGGGASASTPRMAGGRRIPHGDAIGGSKILFDRDDRLWGTTWTDGIFEISGIGAAPDTARRTEVSGMTSADGLTSEQSHALFVDREGNVWIGTELGLDMLRPASIVPEPDIPANSPQGYRIAAARDGSVYVSDSDALYVIAPGGRARRVMRTRSLPGALCASRAGGVWMTLDAMIVHVDGDRHDAFPKPATNAYGCAEDKAGRLWMPGLDKGLFWRRDGRWAVWPGVSPGKAPPSNAAAMPDGTAAILFRSKPAAAKDPPFVPIFKEKLKIGEIEGLLPGRSALYVGGAQGLARIGAGPVRRLAAGLYPWAASINGLVQTDAGDTWAVGDAGVVRVRTRAFDAAFDHPDAPPLDAQLFDFRDGLNSFPQKTPGAQMAAGGDGRIWFLTRRNVLGIDPRQLRRNALAPNVVVTGLFSAGSQFRDPRAIDLPGGTTSVRIRYTALSLAVPSRIQFRYRLDGHDDRWIDAGNRREAIYDNLGPGRFVFRVIASNNDGIWNETGATLDFTIAPTLTQTVSFRILCVLAVLLLGWGLYSLRLRQMSGRLRARMEARAHERERIAREIHDTVLQGVQGLVLRFQSVADRYPDGDPAKEEIESALERADQFIIEARDQVRDLRLIDNRPLEIILCEVAEQQPFPKSTQLESSSKGAPRGLQPLVLHDIVKIAGEALFNAAAHAAPKKVEVQIVYGPRRLEIIVSDDGVGFDPQRHAETASGAHFGILGMRERASRMGASFSIVSEPGMGTDVILAIPAGIAYLRHEP